MAKQYRIQTPDGKMLTVEGPEDATDDELVAFARTQAGPKFQDSPVVKLPDAPVEAPVSKVGADQSFLYGLGDGATLGLLDEAGAVVDSLGLTGGRKNVFNGSSFGDAYDDNVAKNRAILESGQDQHPYASLAGNLTSVALPSSIVGALRLAKGLSAAPKVGRLARLGIEAGQGATYGFNSGEGDISNRVNSAFAGGGTALATGTVLRGLGKVISPAVSPAIQRLKDAGIPLTLGQITGAGGGVGRAIKAVEDKATSIPFVGDAINSARRRGVEAYSRAETNRALSPIGESLPDHVKTGQQAVGFAQNKLSEAYENLLPQMHVKADPELGTKIAAIRTNAMNGGLDEQSAKQLDSTLQHVFARRFDPATGVMTGENLQATLSELKRRAGNFSSAADGNQRELGQALSEVVGHIEDAASRSSGPQLAGRLANINDGYANLTRLEVAAAKASKDGITTPAQMLQAARQMDKSVRKRAFAAGNARMQDLATDAANVLPSQVPDSGTPSRALMALLAGGGVSAGIGSPAPVIAGGLATLPYLPGGRAATEWALTGRQGAVSKKARAILDQLALPAAIVASRSAVQAQ